MDPVTHIALGALTGKSAQRLAGRPESETGPLMLLGVVAALIPDIDIVTFLIEPAYYHAYWHRTYTHSLLMAPVWAVILAYLATLIFSRKFNFKRDFWLLSGCAFAGVLTHIGADAITAWDMGWLLPVSDTKVSLGWVFIIDPLFTLSILFALGLSYVRARLLWVAAWLLPLLWIAQAIYYKEQARDIAENFIPPSAEAIDVWPQPYSATHWKVIGLTETGFLVSHLRLRTSDSPWTASWLPDWTRNNATAYRPIDSLTWVHYEHPLRDGSPETSAAWSHPLMEPVRDFMTYPVVLTETMEEGLSDQAGKASEQNCIWFTDLLYRLPQLPSPFQYGLCKAADGSYERQRRPTHYPWSEP